MIEKVDWKPTFYDRVWVWYLRFVGTRELERSLIALRREHAKFGRSEVDRIPMMYWIEKELLRR